MRANDAYARGEYVIGEQSADAFLKRFPSSSALGEAHYLRGLCRLQLERRDAARADFAAGVAAADRVDLKAKCQAMLAEMAYADGDWSAALADYAASLAHLPARPPTDEALYHYGVCLQRAGRWDEARHAFARLLNEFAYSPKVDAARRRFVWRHDSFAIECASFRRVDDANRATPELRDKGLDIRVEFADLGDASAWRLLTGRYETYEQAEVDLPRVRQVVPGATIVP